MPPFSSRMPVLALIGLLIPDTAFAAAMDGRTMSLWWALPFAGVLLCIATGPVLYHHFWESHQGKIAAFWSLAVVIPLAVTIGLAGTLEAVLHALLLEYLSFIVLLFALFTIAGGVLITGNIHGSPATNLAMLTLGGLLASLIGTTGAAMILIRPMIRANDNRKHNTHVMVFFIFIVANIGGALTPLGDPPLFVGFLRGVDFFWTTRHLAAEMAFVAALVLAVFWALDAYLYRKEGITPADPTPDSRIGLKGGMNLLLLALVAGTIILSALWKPGVSIAFPGGAIELQNLLRDAVLVGLAMISLRFTSADIRAGNDFNWAPIAEVAKLFVAIFLCMIPVVAILHAGRDGALAPLLALVTRADGTPDNVAYFWLTGLLSSLLDNAPTYLVFFELAGGDAKVLMGPMALTLAAISSGAVFMGANTYIGNAPNFMVYAIAKNSGVAMPSFFGYMLWSFGILIPIFVLTTLIFFR